MNHNNRLLARNVYKEYRQTRSKLGEEAANAQYFHNQANTYFILIADYFILQTNMASTGNTDRTQLAIRSSIQLLSNESFLKEHDQDMVDALDDYENLECEITSTARRLDEMQQVFQSFIYLPTRCTMIKTIIKYRPLEFDQILDYLLKGLHQLPTKHALYLSDTIYAMVEMQPKHAHRIRYKLSELRILPNLIIQLTVTFCKDDYVDFLNGIFNSQPSWFLQQSSISGVSLTKIKTSIIQNLSDYVNSLSTSTMTQDQLSPMTPVNVIAIIRALCGLVAFFGVKLTDQETQYCLLLLTHGTSERLLKSLLCLVLVSADQMVKQQKELTKIFIQLIQSGSSEMPLLLMAYFHTDEIGQIEDMVRKTLRMQVPIPKLGLFEMQKLFRSIDSLI